MIKYEIWDEERQKYMPVRHKKMYDFFEGKKRTVPINDIDYQVMSPIDNEFHNVNKQLYDMYRGTKRVLASKNV